MIAIFIILGILLTLTALVFLPMRFGIHYHKGADFEKLYIMFENGCFGTPCFSCRQVILEFFNKDDKIISINKNGDEKVYTVEDLCPYSFGREDLK